MNFLLRTCLSVLFCAYFLILIPGCNTVPYTGRTQLMLVNEQDEAKFADRSWEDVKRRYHAAKDPRYAAALNRVGANLAAASRLPRANWEFVVFDEEVPCVFCLPGVKVGVTTGLFKYLNNDAELAAAVSHAIGHTAARHGGERASELMMTQEGGNSLYQSNLDNNPDLLRIFGTPVPEGRHIPYTWVQEAEADYIGMLFLSEAGYSPQAAFAFRDRMNQLAGDNASLQYFAVHPYSSNRMKELRNKTTKFEDIHSLAEAKRGIGETYSQSMRNPVFAPRPAKPAAAASTAASVATRAPASSGSSAQSSQVAPVNSDPLETAHQALLKKDADTFKLALATAEFNAQQNPDSAAVWLTYGKILAMINNSPQAAMRMEGVFSRVIELDANNYEAQRYLADALYGQELFDSAAGRLESLLAAGHYIDPGTVGLLNLCYLRDGQYQRGITFLTKLADRFPEKDDIRLQLAILARHSGNSRLAMAELRKVVARPGASPEAKQLAGKLMFMNRGRR